MALVSHFPLFEVRIEIFFLNIKYCITTCEPTLLIVIEIFLLSMINNCIHQDFTTSSIQDFFLIHILISQMQIQILAYNSILTCHFPLSKAQPQCFWKHVFTSMKFTLLLIGTCISWKKDLANEKPIRVGVLMKHLDHTSLPLLNAIKNLIKATPS